MNWKNVAFWIMITSLLFLSIYLVGYINSESYSCMKNPLVYGVSLFTDSGGEYTCSCSSPNSKPILVTKDGISIQQFDYLLLSNK